MQEIGEHEDDRSFEDIDCGHDYKDDVLIVVTGAYLLDETDILPLLRILFFFTH